MERPQESNPQHLVELPESLAVAPVGRDVVARREDVAGIQTNPHAFQTLAAIPDLPQLLEGPAQRAPLSGGGLEQYHALAFVGREGPVQGLGHRLQALAGFGA